MFRGRTPQSKHIGMSVLGTSNVAAERWLIFQHSDGQPGRHFCQKRWSCFELRRDNALLFFQSSYIDSSKIRLAQRLLSLITLLCCCVGNAHNLPAEGSKMWCMQSPPSMMDYRYSQIGLLEPIPTQIYRSKYD